LELEEEEYQRWKADDDVPRRRGYEDGARDAGEEMGEGHNESER